MISNNELQQRLSQVENSVHNAAGRCSQTNNVPMNLKNSIQELDQRAGQARSMMQEQSQDEQGIRQCIDDLEQLSDRAKDACEQYGNVDPELRDAVMQAHRELSDLKHQLH